LKIYAQSAEKQALSGSHKFFAFPLATPVATAIVAA
jgi:hypothetical protein